MSARDDLMQIIAWRFHAANPRPTVLDAAVADAIIAAGWTPPGHAEGAGELPAPTPD